MEDRLLQTVKTLKEAEKIRDIKGGPEALSLSHCDSPPVLGALSSVFHPIPSAINPRRHPRTPSTSYANIFVANVLAFVIVVR